MAEKTLGLRSPVSAVRVAYQAFIVFVRNKPATELHEALLELREWVPNLIDLTACLCDNWNLDISQRLIWHKRGSSSQALVYRVHYDYSIDSAILYSAIYQLELIPQWIVWLRNVASDSNSSVCSNNYFSNVECKQHTYLDYLDNFCTSLCENGCVTCEFVTTATNSDFLPRLVKLWEILLDESLLCLKSGCDRVMMAFVHWTIARLDKLNWPADSSHSSIFLLMWRFTQITLDHMHIVLDTDLLFARALFNQNRSNTPRCCIDVNVLTALLKFWTSPRCFSSCYIGQKDTETLLAVFTDALSAFQRVLSAAIGDISYFNEDDVVLLQELHRTVITALSEFASFLNLPVSSTTHSTSCISALQLCVFDHRLSKIVDCKASLTWHWLASMLAHPPARPSSSIVNVLLCNRRCDLSASEAEYRDVSPDLALLVQQLHCELDQFTVSSITLFYPLLQWLLHTLAVHPNFALDCCVRADLVSQWSAVFLRCLSQHRKPRKISAEVPHTIGALMFDLVQAVLLALLQRSLEFAVNCDTVTSAKPSDYTWPTCPSVFDCTSAYAELCRTLVDALTLEEVVTVRDLLVRSRPVLYRLALLQSTFDLFTVVAPPLPANHTMSLHAAITTDLNMLSTGSITSVSVLHRWSVYILRAPRLCVCRIVEAVLTATGAPEVCARLLLRCAGLTLLVDSLVSSEVTDAENNCTPSYTVGLLSDIMSAALVLPTPGDSINPDRTYFPPTHARCQDVLVFIKTLCEQQSIVISSVPLIISQPQQQLLTQLCHCLIVPLLSKGIRRDNDVVVSLILPAYHSRLDMSIALLQHVFSFGITALSLGLITTCLDSCLNWLFGHSRAVQICVNELGAGSLVDGVVLPASLLAQMIAVTRTLVSLIISIDLRDLADDASRTSVRCWWSSVRNTGGELAWRALLLPIEIHLCNTDLQIREYSGVTTPRVILGSFIIEQMDFFAVQVGCSSSSTFFDADVSMIMSFDNQDMVSINVAKRLIGEEKSSFCNGAGLHSKIIVSLSTRLCGAAPCHTCALLLRILPSMILMACGVSDILDPWLQCVSLCSRIAMRKLLARVQGTRTTAHVDDESDATIFSALMSLVTDLIGQVAAVWTTLTDSIAIDSSVLLQNDTFGGIYIKAKPSSRYRLSALCYCVHALCLLVTDIQLTLPTLEPVPLTSALLRVCDAIKRLSGTTDIDSANETTMKLDEVSFQTCAFTAVTAALSSIQRYAGGEKLLAMWYL